MPATISSARQRQVLALLLAAFAGLSLVSLATFERPLPFASPWSAANACGPVGALLAWALVWAMGRVAAFGVPLVSGAWSWNRFRDHPAGPLVVRCALGAAMLFEICALLGLGGAERWMWAGGWGIAASTVLHSALGSVGSWIVAGTLLLATGLVASELGFHWIARLMHGATVVPARGALAVFSSWRERRAAAAKIKGRKPKSARLQKEDEAEKGSRPRIVTPEGAVSATAVDAAEGLTNGGHPQLRLPLPGLGRETPRRPEKTRRDTRPGSDTPLPVPAEAMPSLSLLNMPAQQEDLITATDLTNEANLLVSKLHDFDIEGRVTEIHPGPVVTTFEFEPAAGVKVNQIVSREDDLALALRAQRIRILAPIPGKGAVGVEIPNRRRRTVYLREVLSSKAYEESAAALKMPLGVDVVGEPFVADIATMPHVLVAGATGSGKSVCLNAVITGLLFQHDPRSLQMVMIDPKMLELSTYNGIPHLVMPVVTESKKASRALRWAVAEMEKRYRLMSLVSARHIAAYNEKVAAGAVPRTTGADGSEGPPPERLSYVVVIIDELADLMLTAPAEIEEPIARLAQMARAVGIHLVLATQRPSVDVITGVIKANFPSRIAFRVASKTDSRTVLDANGAENLLGHGDMLLTVSGKQPVRVHGCYVSEEETAKVVEFWKAKAQAVGAAFVPPLATDAAVIDAEEDEAGESGEDFDDELLNQAARLVITHQQGSTSLLQRRLKVGYSRAGRLMDQLESIGVVGPFQGSKARDVLVDERWLVDRGLE
ncbi:MAG: DNA translocase FtsK 4TM domain-containing protein [Candidatus Eisenbacteria bacterium]